MGSLDAGSDIYFILFLSLDIGIPQKGGKSAAST